MGWVSATTFWELWSAKFAGDKVKKSKIFNATSARGSSVGTWSVFCVLYCSLCVKLSARWLAPRNLGLITLKTGRKHSQAPASWARDNTDCWMEPQATFPCPPSYWHQGTHWLSINQKNRKQLHQLPGSLRGNTPLFIALRNSLFYP